MDTLYIETALVCDGRYLHTLYIDIVPFCAASQLHILYTETVLFDGARYLPSDEVSVVPVEPLGVDSEELKAEALFWPTASLEDDTPLLPSKLQSNTAEGTHMTTISRAVVKHA